MSDLPDAMHALQMDAYHENLLDAIRSLHVVTKPVAQPSYGEVLIRVEAAPCNPSDLLLLQGLYGSGKTLPTVPGWEGAGTVVASNGSMRGKWLMDKRVAFTVRKDVDGTWAQYAVTDAKNCIVLKKEVSTEQGASLIINPLTAWGLLDRARVRGHKAIIQTAAASQLGRMVLQLANEQGIPSIHIVRRTEQEHLLKELGAQMVLNSESEDFERELKNAAERVHATIAFDAVAGGMTGRLLRCMPEHSTVLVYGALSGEVCSEINPHGLIFHQKKVEGFYLPNWIAHTWRWQLHQAASHIQKQIANGAFHTHIRAQVSLEEAPTALEAYQHEMTLGKILIKP